ncbi:MAG: phosphonate metabolism protein/1,5-bisphosphokinase (PRPP-forming) PhnN [Reyranella sp.]|nr:phosphonate metabolism protein/1,5-bisphosphokinase (PRPP-forming) PhnN [Reyranella sp.]
MTPLVTAPLFYVMGPSGAGKDSVLARARALLPADTSVVFAHRYITRPPEASGENHVALSAAEFAMRRTHGLFAFHWEAHGNHYGIGREIHAWRKAGLTVVVSGSREHFQNVAGVDPETYPVLITAPAALLRDRLAARGREDEAAAARRLERSDAYDVHDPRLITITNDGPLDTAARTLVTALATIRSAPVARLRA